jgi:hypothetical protein
MGLVFSGRESNIALFSLKVFLALPKAKSGKPKTKFYSRQSAK